MIKMPCSIFTYYDQFIGNKEKYIVIHKDIFPSVIKEEYDNALTIVRNDINIILLREFFKENFRMEPAISISTGTISQCPENRRYELEIWDRNKEQILHGFIYQKGKVIKTIGNIDKIISVWKER